jgi:hypothetical protein
MVKPIKRSARQVYQSHQHGAGDAANPKKKVCTAGINVRGTIRRSAFCEKNAPLVGKALGLIISAALELSGRAPA